MFFSFFSSKNQKLVKKWKSEHEEMVISAHKIIAAYSLDDKDSVRKELITLRKLALEHLMLEDIELFKLLREDKDLEENTEEKIREFRDTFRDTKSSLLDFLREYTQEDAQLDKRFFDIFSNIVSVLSKRIDFEENNLYISLEEK
ncbi:hypothetical protein M947_07500 [Sulfurimonas hongkongensis]|uniref:Hemerythrin-like domain-containing protein n=1 Tax=Sulfurimonas hongkongensis TaxID=1172190 RepID=T0JE58_9BACT|nr:hypothetical protein [Sulfurimonas hongkongensis]EQB39295.1 hypothetical protein M947_07500 [Sulfurimonas hongkongensis]